jgi:hypothetical protein
MKDADVFEIPVSFRVVQPVTYDEFVGNREADVIALDRFQPTRRFIEQSGQTERFRTALAKNPQEVGGREAGVENVLDQDHVEPRDVIVQILEHAHLARGIFRLSVARDGDEIDRSLQINFAGQIGKKETSALEHANQMNPLALEISRDLAGDCADTFLDVGVTDSDLQTFFCCEWHRFRAPAVRPVSLSHANHCDKASRDLVVGKDEWKFEPNFLLHRRLSVVMNVPS